MTVYVDDMYLLPMGRYNRMKMSHMIATTDDELHAMAARIGVARKWFQDVPSGAHYDVSMSMRSRALECDAMAITVRQLSSMCAIRRHDGTLPTDPVAAEQLWKIYIRSQA